MLTNVINAGKDIANKLTNKFLNLSEVEAKIKEATSDDKWGPYGSLMKEIADETFSTTTFHEAMTFLWYRIFTEKPLNNRRIYKGLVLLQYLVINGSEYVAISCKSHISEITKLKLYNDLSGVADLSIRKKAEDICELLSDSQRLSDQRKRAKAYKTRCYPTDNAPGVISRESNTRTSQSLGDIDDWKLNSKSVPQAIGESFINFVNNFTQNISGPPPTETHDNFDIPPVDTEITKPVHEDDTYKPTSKPKSYSFPVVEKKSCSIRTDNENKIKEPNNIVQEVSIIDFSEPTNETPKPNDMQVFSKSENITDKEFEVEFDNLRDWQHFESLPNRNSQLNSGNNFPTNFDVLNSPFVSTPSRIVPTTNPQETNSKPQSPQSPQSKSQMKLGATWNDIDSLKIDLNNLCGRKHLYSKS